MISKFLSMPLWLHLFLFIMIFLTVYKCWIEKEKEGIITKRYKIIVSLIAFFSCLTGAYYLYETLPSPASPQINHLFFFGSGDLQSFRYCCEFEIRNDGETPCSLEKVEFILEDTEFTNAKTGQVRVASGSSGSLGGRDLGGGAITYDVGSSYFPQSLSIIPQGFCIMGQATNPKARSGANIANVKEETILIKFYFKSGSNTLIEERTVPIIYGTIHNIRL